MRSAKNKLLFINFCLISVVLICFTENICFGQVIRRQQNVRLETLDPNVTRPDPVRYLTVVSRLVVDVDNNGFFCDPSGISQFNSLRGNAGAGANSGVTIFFDDTLNPALLNHTIFWSAGYSLNLDGLDGSGRLGNVATSEIRMRASGPPESFSVQQRSDGKFVFDIAESITVIGAQACDVAVISSDFDLVLVRSAIAYDTKVAGVISESPKIYMGSNLQDKSKPLALAGVVRCNVNTENGPVKKGDLLVTSSEPGYAMRADTGKVTPGMVVGSALEPLAQGKGKIHILINQ